jgi:hypothetical protein
MKHVPNVLIQSESLVSLLHLALQSPPPLPQVSTATSVLLRFFERAWSSLTLMTPSSSAVNHNGHNNHRVHVDDVFRRYSHAVWIDGGGLLASLRHLLMLALRMDVDCEDIIATMIFAQRFVEPCVYMTWMKQIWQQEQYASVSNHVKCASVAALVREDVRKVRRILKQCGAEHVSL